MTTKNLLTMLILGYMFLMPNSPVSGEEKFAIIGADTWCPYTCKSGKGFNGFAVELTQEALKLKGWKTEFKNASFDRVTKQVEQGYWHIAMATDEVFTPSLLITKEPVAYTKWVFVVRKGVDWKYQRTDSLKEMRLGVVKGYVYSPEVTAYIDTQQDPEKVFAIASVTPQRQGLTMLIQKHIDVYLEDEAAIGYWAKQIGITDKIEIAGVDFETPLFNGLKMNDENAAQLAEDMDCGIRELKNTETMKLLLKKYDITIWK